MGTKHKKSLKYGCKSPFKILLSTLVYRYFDKFSNPSILQAKSSNRGSPLSDNYERAPGSENCTKINDELQKSFKSY